MTDSQRELADVWPEIQAALRVAVGDGTFNIWLADVQPVSLDGEHLIVSAPRAIHSWIVDRFTFTLDAATSLVVGQPCFVDVVSRMPIRQMEVFRDELRGAMAEREIEDGS